MKGAKIVLALLLAAVPWLGVAAADFPIYPTGPTYAFAAQPSIGPLAWGVSGPGGFNNNFYFVPYYPAESVCVYVKNNNPTNPHTFTAAIAIIPDPSNTTPSDGTWQNSASSTFTVAASPSFAAGLGASVAGVAKISINLSGSSAQAGSPDTASVTLIQTTGVCFAGNNFVSSSPQGVGAFPPIQIVSDALSQAFTFQSGTISNPAAGAEIAGVNDNNSTKSLYFDKVIISASAAASVNINGTNTAGGTCTLATPGSNINLGAPGGGSSAQGTQGCTVVPSVNFAYLTGLPLAAGVPVTIDLRGFIVPAGGTKGMDVVMTGALTGTIAVAFSWYEK